VKKGVRHETDKGREENRQGMKILKNLFPAECKRFSLVPSKYPARKDKVFPVSFQKTFK
jgi:hypothetical protein